MFSQTILGHLINEMLCGRIHGIDPRNHPLTMINLLLADASIHTNTNTLPHLVDWLRKVYSEQSMPPLYEEAPDQDLCKILKEIIQEKELQDNAVALAYLGGMSNLEKPTATDKQVQRVVDSIYIRSRRIFFKETLDFRQKIIQPKPIAILGLKGSGKSTILRALSDRGEQVHEIYKYLERIPVIHRSLPHPKLWEEEPMLTGLRCRKWHEGWPTRFFVGSLLRLSEIRALYRIGQPVLIKVATPNAMRHNRVKNRGRQIEVNASSNQLIELDAHRGGEWPGYETNDVGTLLALAPHTIVNDGTHSINELVEQIMNLVENQN